MPNLTQIGSLRMLPVLQRFGDVYCFQLPFYSLFCVGCRAILPARQMLGVKKTVFSSVSAKFYTLLYARFPEVVAPCWKGWLCKARRKCSLDLKGECSVIIVGRVMARL